MLRGVVTFIHKLCVCVCVYICMCVCVCVCVYIYLQIQYMHVMLHEMLKNVKNIQSEVKS